jgi:hypothetical protein
LLNVLKATIAGAKNMKFVENKFGHEPGHS